MRTPATKHSVRAGNTLYLSASEGATATLREQMRVNSEVLAENGFQLSDVVSSQIWVTDIGTAREVSKDFREFFKKGALPTGTISEVSALPGGAYVDVALVAVKGAKKIIRPDPSLSFSPAILAGDSCTSRGMQARIR